MSKKLQKFITDRKTPKQEYFIELVKSDPQSTDCPQCGKTIFNGTGFSNCVCFGDNRNSKVYLKKTEDGLHISFSKSWDADNILMLLEFLRGKRNG